MDDDFFLINIPNFEPAYKSDTSYGWSNDSYYDNTIDLLCNTTGGYCMYCYNRILINGQNCANIEHGVETSNSPKTKRLADCVPNLGLACSKCNGKYKTRGQLKRAPSKKDISFYERGTCKSTSCKRACNKFINLRKKYTNKGHIILQPFGVTNELTGHEYKIQYDLLKGKYIPCHIEGGYTNDEIVFIQEHIKLFNLNDAKRKNREVAKYCKNVLKYHSILEDIEYNNLVVDLFRNKLLNLEINKVEKICAMVCTYALRNYT